VLGIQCGVSSDTSSTFFNATGVFLQNCTADITQNGSSTLHFFGGVFNPATTTINGPTNVSFVAIDNAGILALGNNANIEHIVYEIWNGQGISQPVLDYEPNYYGNQGTVYRNSSS